MTSQISALQRAVGTSRAGRRHRRRARRAAVLSRALREPMRVWYAADEWVLHHLSQLQLASADSCASI